MYIFGIKFVLKSIEFFYWGLVSIIIS